MSPCLLCVCYWGSVWSGAVCWDHLLFDTWLPVPWLVMFFASSRSLSYSSLDVWSVSLGQRSPSTLPGQPSSGLVAGA